MGVEFVVGQAAVDQTDLGGDRAVVAAVLSWLLFRWSKQLVVALVGGLVLWWAIVFVLSVLGLRT